MNLVKTLAPEGTIPTEIMTADQLCKKLNISMQTLIGWKKDGVIPYLKVRSVIRYDLHKVLESIEIVARPETMEGSDPWTINYIWEVIKRLNLPNQIMQAGLKINAGRLGREKLAITFFQGMNKMLLIMPIDSLFDDDHWRAMLTELFGRGQTDGRK